MPATQRADGSLSQYGLACGHIQRVGGIKTRVDLFQEYGTYFVRGYYNGRKVVDKGFSSNGLTEARKFFSKVKKELAIGNYNIES